jgi:hypothetical protein
MVVKIINVLHPFMGLQKPSLEIKLMTWLFCCSIHILKTWIASWITLAKIKLAH